MNEWNCLMDAFVRMETHLGEDALAVFSACRFCALHQWHLTFGIWVRNTLLPETGALYHLFQSCGVAGRDEMSALLLRLFYCFLKSRTQ